jgi:hypothetical protein
MAGDFFVSPIVNPRSYLHSEINDLDIRTFHLIVIFVSTNYERTNCYFGLSSACVILFGI